jgi:hypothetical protein
MPSAPHRRAHLSSNVRRQMRAVCALLLFTFAVAFAAPPPFGEWLRLRVTSCQPVILLAPDDIERATRQLYEHGERKRATLVFGEVLEARNYTSDGKWIWKFPPPARALVGTYTYGYIDEPTDASCPSSTPTEITFVRGWSCDVGWRRGSCLAPFPQLVRVPVDEPLLFVSPPQN